MVLHPQAEAESTRQSSRAEQATARAQRLDEEVQRLHATQQEAQEQLAGRVELQVLSTAQGMTAGSFVDYEYTPAMLVDRVAPAKGPVTGGTVVTLRGTNFPKQSPNSP